MKKMYIFLSFIFAVLFLFNPAIANTIDTSELTEKQRAELALKIASMKESDSESFIDQAKKVNDWASVGQNMGIAVASAAKEIGVAADDLLKTDVGKITVVLVAWKVAGKDMVELTEQVMGYIIGIFLLVVSIPIWLYTFRRICISTVEKIEYPEKGFKRIKHFRTFDPDDKGVSKTRLIMGVVLLADVLISLLVMFA